MVPRAHRHACLASSAQHLCLDGLTRRPRNHGRPDYRPEPIRAGRRRRRRDHGRRPEDLHEGGDRGVSHPPRAGRLLGDLVRPVQAAHPYAGEGGEVRRRPGENGEDRHRSEPRPGAAARPARAADAVGAHGRRLLAGPDRRPVPGRRAGIRSEALRRGPAETCRRLDAQRRPPRRGEGCGGGRGSRARWRIVQ